MALIRTSGDPKLNQEVRKLLQWISPNSREVAKQILETFSNNKSRKDLTSTAYQLVERFFILELQINLLKCPCDVHEIKISGYIQEKSFNNWYATCIDYNNHYSFDIWESWGSRIIFPDNSGVGGIRLAANTIPLSDPLLKSWEYGMVISFEETPKPDGPFFSVLTKFQKYMFKKIHWFCTAKDGPTVMSNSHRVFISVNSAVVEFEDGKAKPAHYLIRLIDRLNPEEFETNWMPETHQVIVKSSSARAIGFFNIYRQICFMKEKNYTVIHCGNTTFGYPSQWHDDMKVDEDVSEDVFDYLYDVKEGTFLSEEGKVYLQSLLESWYLELNEVNSEEDYNQDDYEDYEGFEDHLGYEGTLNLLMDD